MSKRLTEEPVTLPGRDEGTTITTHPAFGSIGVSRVSGHTVLYGSDFHHQNYMVLRIGSSELRRRHSNDWHFGDRGTYVEVALSESQWATLISAPNIGTGVPCTIEHLNGQCVPGIPDPVNRKLQFEGEARQSLAEAKAQLVSLRQTIEATKLSNAAKASLISQTNRVEGMIGNSLEFIADQFREHMEETVEKAKQEINVYAMQVAKHTGLPLSNPMDAPKQIATRVRERPPLIIEDEQ